MNILAPPRAEPSSIVSKTTDPPSRRCLLLWTAIAVISFHVAYSSSSLAWLSLLYLFVLLQLGRAASWRKAFYSGLAAGLLIAAGRLDFFRTIFGMGALALWLVFAFWIGLFTAGARACFTRLPRPWALCSIPVLWCGLEYFRSELYYLKFSWLSPGYAFGLNPVAAPLKLFGVYGIGLVLMALACGAAALVWRRLYGPAILLCVLGSLGLYFGGQWLPSPVADRPHKELALAGMQLEFPAEPEVLPALEKLRRQSPKSPLLVLSEYTFDGPVPEPVKSWCRRHQKYLVAGAKTPLPGNRFYNTAVVVSPDGEIIFSQVKAVPIQFFKDGVAAPNQRVWESPWGKIGICICYDLSYTRVTDELIRLGAEALIVPTMDVADWGARQHQLHARVGPVRAAEYGIPIFRLASSGISQAIDTRGRLLSSSPFPGGGSILEATLALTGGGSRPLDRWIAPASTALTIAGMLALIFDSVRRRLRGKRCFS